MSVTIFRHRKRQWIVKCEHNGILEFPTLADAKRFAQVTFGLSGKWRRFESPMTGYVTYEEVPT